jgi:hypothetical protein
VTKDVRTVLVGSGYSNIYQGNIHRSNGTVSSNRSSSLIDFSNSEIFKTEFAFICGSNGEVYAKDFQFQIN